uniref:PCI domain-containing protein n=1 Tax=Panagrellus redivivus TaxID=6233 RepID=A0A7E4W3L7_PANRE
MASSRISREDILRRSADFISDSEKWYAIFEYFHVDAWVSSKTVIKDVLEQIEVVTSSINPAQGATWAKLFYSEDEIRVIDGGILAQNLIDIFRYIRSEMPTKTTDYDKMLFHSALQRKGALDFEGAVTAFESIVNESGSKSVHRTNKLIDHVQNLCRIVAEIKRETRANFTYRELVERTLESVLKAIALMDDKACRLSMYGVFLDNLKESTNDRLWFKTTTKLAKLYLDEKDYAKLDAVLKDLKASCLTPTGETVENKGTQLLEVYAIEVQKFTLQNNNKALQIVYNQALKIKATIPHPLITGTIRECGGKMHLRNGDYEQAYTDFFVAFKDYDEAGSARRIACLKYLVLANMLTKSDIDPFDSEETKAFRDEPDIVVIIALKAAYKNGTPKQFHVIVNNPNNTIFADPFAAEMIDRARMMMLHQMISPYTSVSLQHLSEEMCISVAEVTRLLTETILDNDSEYVVDEGMVHVQNRNQQQH